ncbi:MAG: hypothetical protein ACK56I_06460, partial [bacterium]
MACVRDGVVAMSNMEHSPFLSRASTSSGGAGLRRSGERLAPRQKRGRPTCRSGNAMRGERSNRGEYALT